MDVFRPDLTERAAGEQNAPERRLPPATQRLPHVVAMVVGIGAALLVSVGGGPAALWGKTTGLFSTHQNFATTLSESDLDHQKPQKQAEILLERAVSRSNGATGQVESEIGTEIEAQIEARIDAWRGQLKWDSQLGDLTTVALNSSDRSVRASAVEVQLAAYGLTKSASTVDALVRQASSRDHTQKIWALWALGLLGNRGVDTDRVVQVLAAQLQMKDSGKDSNRHNDVAGNTNTSEDARSWAVEGLALVGTTPTIAPLLDAMRNDPSAAVRERAACSLARAGMLSHQQRLIAVPQLINYASDPALDAQTQAWAFQALANITKQSLPNDSAAWRNWYQNSNSGN
jgi:hypothetical protein